MFFARLEIQILLHREHGQYVFVCNQVLRISPSSQLQEAPLVAKSARVVDEMADGDRGSEIRQLGNVFAYIIIQRQLSLLSKQKNGCRRKLFRHAGNVENG